MTSFFLSKTPLRMMLVSLCLLDFSIPASAEDIPTFSPTIQLLADDTKDQDDMCIWVKRDNPAQSTIIVSDKSAGQVVVYGLDGEVLQTVAVPKPGNIDIRQNVEIDGQSMDLVVVNQRADGFKLIVFRLNPDLRKLERIDDHCNTDPNYGGCLFRCVNTGRLYSFCTSDTGTVGQYELKGNGRGGITATKVRTLAVGKCEGAVADDENGQLYIAEEKKGVWKFAADPDASVIGNLIASIGENGLKGDVEGLTIAKADLGGFLLVSDQGRSRFLAYEREMPHHFVGEFAVNGANHTDGIDVDTTNFGSLHPEGVFACHTDDKRCGVMLTPWGPIARALALRVPAR